MANILNSLIRCIENAFSQMRSILFSFLDVCFDQLTPRSGDRIHERSQHRRRGRAEDDYGRLSESEDSEYGSSSDDMDDRRVSGAGAHGGSDRPATDQRRQLTPAPRQGPPYPGRVVLHPKLARFQSRLDATMRARL